jgi:hypothetical protein
VESPGIGIASLVIAAIGGVAAILPLVRDYPLWLTLGGVAVITVSVVVGVWATFFRSAPEPAPPPPVPAPPPRIFIDGPADRSTFDGVTVNADRFITDSARDAKFRNVKFRADQE